MEEKIEDRNSSNNSSKSDSEINIYNNIKNSTENIVDNRETPRDIVQRLYSREFIDWKIRMIYVIWRLWILIYADEDERQTKTMKCRVQNVEKVREKRLVQTV